MQTIAVYMFTLSSTLIVFATVVTNISLLIRHRQLKKQRADGTKVVTYSAKDGTLNSKTVEDKSLSQSLLRHERTVVTPQASQFSFVLRLLGIPSAVYIYHISHSSGLPPWAQFFIFTIFSQCFLLFNLIEAIFSPTLRNSLKDYLFCRHPRQIHMPAPLEECLNQRSIKKAMGFEASGLRKFDLEVHYDHRNERIAILDSRDDCGRDFQKSLRSVPIDVKHPSHSIPEIEVEEATGERGSTSPLAEI